MDNNKETYDVAARCTNCGTETCGEVAMGPKDIILIIPKGKTVKQFASNTKCPNCGCYHCLGRK